MNRSEPVLWTVVQHSGFGYAGKEGFKRGLEPRQIENRRQYELIIRTGGMVFQSYGAASDYAEAEMYPDDSSDIYPRARGRFVKAQIDGLAVYIPLTGVAP